jgi:hypothetical protein
VRAGVVRDVIVVGLDNDDDDRSGDLARTLQNA